MQDSTADMRLFRRGSLLIRIGPVSGPDVEVGHGVEPALRLRSLLEEGDPEVLARFVDKYLAGAGMGLHLWGDERLPKRPLVWNMVRSADGARAEGAGWDRACLRIANVHALIVRHASSLPVDKEWLSSFLDEHVASAERCYEVARASPDLAPISDSNLALLRLFSGKAEEALGILGGLGDSHEMIVKRTMALDALGRREDALAELSRIPAEGMDRRATALRLRLEGAP
jgi:hypothetical protein